MPLFSVFGYLKMKENAVAAMLLRNEKPKIQSARNLRILKYNQRVMKLNN
jgi:hypothetical protein